MNADLLVIGGGIMGMMAAYKALKDRPDATVIQLERSMVCSGATRFCAAFAPVYGRSPEVLKMAIQSREAYMRIKNKVPSIPMFEQPSYWITRQDNVEALNQKLYHPFTDLAEPEDWASACIVDSGFSRSPDTVMLSHHIGHYSLPTQFSFHMLNQLKSHDNYRLMQSVEVNELQFDGKNYQVMTSDGTQTSAKRVIVAIGPWFSDAEFLSAHHDLEIRVKKVVAFHIHKKPPVNARAIFYPDYDAFLLPVKETGNWVFSYTCDHWDVRPDANALHVDADNRNKALAVLEKMAPNFVPYCAGGHAFCDTYSKDYIPVVAKGLQGDNLVIITGANGAGFRLAPALANKAIALFEDAL